MNYVAVRFRGHCECYMLLQLLRVPSTSRLTDPNIVPFLVASRVTTCRIPNPNIVPVLMELQAVSCRLRLTDYGYFDMSGGRGLLRPIHL